MNPRHGRRQTPIALVRHGDDASGLHDAEVAAADPHVRAQKLLLSVRRARAVIRETSDTSSSVAPRRSRNTAATSSRLL